MVNQDKQFFIKSRLLEQKLFLSQISSISLFVTSMS